MDTIFTKIDDLYNKSGYMDRYGLDVWVTIFLLIIFILAISYYNVMNNIQPIKADWINKRCSPNVIPFAGLINKGPEETTFEYTQKNFTECIQTILTSISDDAFNPFYYLMNIISETFKSLISAIAAIRAQFYKIREASRVFAEQILGRALNITVPLINFFIVIKAMLGKTMGTITSALYTLLGSYFGIKSFMLFFISLVMEILYALVGTIVGLWVASFFLPFLIPVAISTTVVMTAILIPTVIIQVMMSNVMELTTSPPPGVPACFAESTKLELEDGRVVSIKDIEIEDILKDGSKVDAVMKLSSHHQTIYNLHGVIVTGNHSIYHATKGWISVDEHPESFRVDSSEFIDPFVYCINTDTKVVKIGSLTFSDWDDLDDLDFEHLKTNSPLTTSFKTGDIHKCLGAGFHEDSVVELDNGRSVKISDVNVNDSLRNGARVCGVIKINGENTQSGLRKYTFAQSDGGGKDKVNTLCCSKNIFVNDPNLGLHNSSIATMDGQKVCDSKYLYNILTDSGNFVVNGIRVQDFNASIENYLPTSN
tara:strand:- start:2145 stop:3761 length:1617 start_codon:yes stop_codon:yes gene_type:complete